MNQTRKIEIIEDYDGTKIVKINEIQFKGRQKIDWKQVKDYLKEFVGKSFLIDETSEIVFIGTDFPDEYKG